MTGLDAAARVPGYYDSPFSGEDGGPRRQLAPRSAGLGIRDGERLEVTARTMPFANMVVLRAPGEVFVQGNTQPWDDTTSWVERIDPVTLATLARSPELPGGPFWAGGILAHENGDLYVTWRPGRVEKALEQKGITPGDQVVIGDHQFTYRPEPKTRR